MLRDTKSFNMTAFERNPSYGYILNTSGRTSSEISFMEIRSILHDVYAEIKKDDVLSKRNIITGSGHPIDIVNTLMKINQRYDFSGHSGIYYPDEYKYENKKIPPNELHEIYGVANYNYWSTKKLNSNEGIIRAVNGVSPSDALRAFFHGPTISNNNAVINACVYQTILNRIGKDNFDNVFGYIMTQFTISSELFKPYTSIGRDDSDNNGNPLYNLFDIIPTHELKLENLRTGDIICIEGSNAYEVKHFTNQPSCENLVCIKQFDNDEVLFVKFNPKSSPQILSYDDVRKCLIDKYNLPISHDVCQRIKRYLSDYYIPVIPNPNYPDTIIEATEHLSARLSNVLRFDGVGYDEKINGLRFAVRLNFNKVDDLVRRITNEVQVKSWMNFDVQLMKNSLNVTDNKFELTNIPYENIHSTFDNFLMNTEMRKNMYYTCKRFVDAIVSDKYINISPLCLVLNGENNNGSGIGKTHLGVSTAKFAAARGRKVTFLDAMTVENMKKCDVDNLYKECDLIIFDNACRENYSCLYQIIEYVINKKKAIFITSCINLDYSRFFRDYPLYNDSKIYDFVVLNNLNGVSERCSKKVDVLYSPNKEDIEQVFEKSDRSCVIVDPSRTKSNGVTKLSFLKEHYSKVCSNKKVTVIKGDDTDDINKLNETKYDAVVYCVESYREEKYKFIELMSTAHNQNLRMILLMSNFNEFKANALYKINNDNDITSMKDRFRILFE